MSPSSVRPLPGGHRDHPLPRLGSRNGLEILDLIELYASDDETRTPMAIPPTWAQRWPVEEVWRVRRTAAPTDV